MSMIKTLLATGLLPALMLGVGIVQADDIRDAILKAADNETGGEYVRTRYLQLAKVPFDSQDSRKKALIIGDSHAQDFLNAVLEQGALNHYQIRTRYLPNVCQLYLGDEDVSAFIEEKNKALCAEADNLQQAKTQIAEADLVMIVASWKDWSAERLPTTIKNLELKPEQTLRVLGRKSFGKINVRNYLRQPEATLPTLRNPVDEHQSAINQTLRSKLDPSIFIDIHQLVCGEGDTCPLFTPDLRLISFDGGHLTPDGAKYVGKLLFTSPLLADL